MSGQVQVPELAAGARVRPRVAVVFEPCRWRPEAACPFNATVYRAGEVWIVRRECRRDPPSPREALGFARCRIGRGYRSVEAAEGEELLDLAWGMILKAVWEVEEDG